MPRRARQADPPSGRHPSAGGEAQRDSHVTGVKPLFQRPDGNPTLSLRRENGSNQSHSRGELAPLRIVQRPRLGCRGMVGGRGRTRPLASTRRCSPNKQPGPSTAGSTRLQGVVRDSRPRNAKASTPEPSRAPRLQTGPALARAGACHAPLLVAGIATPVEQRLRRRPVTGSGRGLYRRG
jgi:hypothetical protein